MEKQWCSISAIYILPVQNGLEQGNALSPSLFNFPVEYAITKVQENQEPKEHISFWSMLMILIYWVKI
jgi:hypothetical protein